MTSEETSASDTSQKALQSPRKHFSSVRQAREALKEEALGILQEYKAAIKMAIAAGKYEEGLKAYQWLIDHIPNEGGTRIFDSSSDKMVQVEGNKGPVIQIGFQLGGIDLPKALEGEVVKDE